MPDLPAAPALEANTATDLAPPVQTPSLSAPLLVVLTTATAVLIANLYYAQPLIASIAPELGISPDLAGLIVSVTQIGYGIGLFLLVPAADLVENRRLVLILMALAGAGVVALALATGPVAFFAAALLTGVCATAAQVLLPFVAHLTPEARRGRITGNVMAGVLTGIMLARPVALFIAGTFGWRAVFWFSAALIAALWVALWRLMPVLRPGVRLGYGPVLRSMLRIPRSMPALCWRSAYGAGLFGVFNMFWTAVPLLLAQRFGLAETSIGWFALAGAGGALVAPVAGRLSDRGLELSSTAAAMVVVGAAFIGTGWAASALALVPLIVFAVLIDAGVQVNQIVSRRTVFGTAPELRGRVNALYMTSLFVGGAAGSTLGTVTFHGGGWTATALTGAAVALGLLGLLGIEVRGLRQ